jgi:hypothetical protein
MSKEKVLAEIKEFREAFNKIKPDQFEFDTYVSKFNDDLTCGTICCLWGWIPQIAPEIAERYDLYYDPKGAINLSQSPSILTWPYLIRSYLFLPEHKVSNLKYLQSNAELSEVLEAWDNVIAILEKTDQFDFLF